MTLLDEYELGASRPFGEARALPYGVYHDPQVYELERKLVYDTWIPICPAGLLAKAGDYFAVDLAGEPILVIRGDDGELRALSNVCRHRGTPLAAEGFGNARTFVCAFHAWSYDTAGKLLAVPHPGTAKIDRAAHCLPQFPIVVWKNQVFIHLNENPEPFEKTIEGVEEIFEQFGFFGEFPNDLPEIQCWSSNWKLAVENSHEPYHLFRVHKESLEDTSPTAGWFGVSGSARMTSFAGKVMGEFTRDYQLVVGLHPFTTIVNLPAPRGKTQDSWTILTTLPDTSAETTKLIVGGFASFENDYDEARAGDEATAVNFLHEDEVQCDLQQRAMRAQRTRGGPQLHLERICVDFHNHLAWRLFGSEAPKPWVGRIPA